MNLSRRRLALGLAGLPLLGAATPLCAQPSSLQFLFVGADDCEPCRRWHSDEGHWWQSSPEFSRVDTLFIRARRTRHAYDDAYWLPHLRRFRDMPGAPRATPAYFVVRNDQLLLAAAGYTAWRREIYPALREMVAAADSGRGLQARSS
jgi:hypothetical protein